MFVRAVLVIVVCFEAFEVSTKEEAKFQKTYPSNGGGYNPNLQDNKVNAIIDELQLLRHQLETIPRDESRRAYKNFEPLGSNASKRLKQPNFVEDLLPGSLDYLIAKLEAEERHNRQQHGPGFLKKNIDPSDQSGFTSFVKKNFDPIDRSGFGSFVKKNFDTIDSSGFSSFEKKNFDPIDSSGFSSFSKKNIDPIDVSGFSTFIKKNFDSLDRSGFSSFDKKKYAKKMIDPIDRSGFGGFVKKNFDTIDRAGFDNFIKKRSIPSKEIRDDGK